MRSTLGFSHPNILSVRIALMSSWTSVMRRSVALRMSPWTAPYLPATERETGAKRTTEPRATKADQPRRT